MVSTWPGQLTPAYVTTLPEASVTQRSEVTNGPLGHGDDAAGAVAAATPTAGVAKNVADKRAKTNASLDAALGREHLIFADIELSLFAGLKGRLSRVIVTPRRLPGLNTNRVQDAPQEGKTNIC